MNNLNFEIFANRPCTLAEFDDGESFLLTRNIIKEGDSILDIGGASGNFLHMINKEIVPIKGTVLEVDQDCIDYGKEHFPEIEFLKMNFPEELPDQKYDIVLMNSLFPHFVDWKKNIRAMASLAKRYIDFNAILREHGRTIADDEVSYFYYLDTGERKAQTVLNILEAVNFLCLEEIRAKAIHFHGAFSMNLINPSLIDFYDQVLKGERIPEMELCKVISTHTFRGIMPYDQINGSFTVELFDGGKQLKRMGGVGKTKAELYDQYKFSIPDISININKLEYWKVENGEMFCNLGAVIDSPRFTNLLRLASIGALKKS